jgi:bla regulator protein BlaR1
MSYYALVPGRHGAKMESVKMLPDDFHGTTWGGRIDSVLTMPTLAHLLSRFDTERPVIDETGLTGMYKVNLLWTPPGRNQGGDNGAEPPLFTAIEDQLGLKLEAKKGPLETLVVDSVDKVPTDN